ncbi:hypothetical protein GCM10025331_10910 [Actinoplanes utahensis]|uniref:nucleotidyltransferase family protein n=1 Tax=Actinoplanes utahensis TaxID=1869 RepID=UPI000A075251|nr:nucleotidyltransferase family protein [Actinoplanes utahensis]
MNSPVTVPGLPAEQRVIAGICTTAEDTVRAWGDLPAGFLDVDWAEVSLLATQHRVEGLLHESLELAGCADQVPVSVLAALRRRADLAETRYRACYAALVDVARRAPDLVAEMVFFKGADLASRYGSPAHRMIRDFDLIVPAARVADVRKVFESLDFWEKPGQHGPMFVSSPEHPQIGAEYVAFDVHLDTPADDDTTEPGHGDRWLGAAVPAALGEVACRRLSLEYALLELLADTGKHALSWIQVCLDSDVRLIRALDAELLCGAGEIDTELLAGMAARSGLDGHLAVGLAVHRAVRGELPPALSSLGGHADAGADVADMVALPDGRLLRWAIPLRDRALRSDRAVRALAMMPPQARHRGHWFDWRRGLLAGAENVAELTRRARDRLGPRPAGTLPPHVV